MDVKVLRYNSSKDFTDGLLHIDNEFMCYTLEDEFRTNKVFGETRIPDGRYKIEFRTEGGFNSRYLKKFGSDFHSGMLQVKDVPGFEYILIHIGNTDDDTAGCLLVGMSCNADDNGFIGESTKAYKKVYKKIKYALKNKEDVYITYTTIG